MTHARLLKFIGMGVVLLAVSAGAWWSFRHAFTVGVDFSTLTLRSFLALCLAPLLLFTLTIAVQAVLGAMARPHWAVATAALLASLTPFLFFSPTVWLAAASAIVFFDSLYFLQTIGQESRGLLRFSMLKVSRPHLGLIVAVFAVAISFAFYSHTTVSERRQGVKALDLLSTSSVNLANLVLPSFVEEYHPDMTLDAFILRNGPALFAQFAPRIAEGEDLPQEATGFSSDELMAAFREAVAKGDIPREEIPPDIAAKLDAGTLTLDDLVQEGNERLFATQLEAFRSELAKSFGVPLAGDELMADVLRKVATQQLQPFVERHERLITPLIAAAFGFLLLAFGWFYQLLIKLWASFAVWLLVRLGFFVLRRVPAEQEHLTY